MMQEHASSGDTTTLDFEFIVPTHKTTSSKFTFPRLPLPEMGLTFLPRPPPRPLKRGRSTGDIDGEHSCMQKKKRRLRLFLITSRLSPQFSHPATNIVDRGSSKIAVWAKQKSLGRNILRKAAILNRIRRRAPWARGAQEGQGRVLVEQEKEQEELKLARLEFNHGSFDTYTRPVSSVSPSVPPPAAVRSGGRFIVSGSPTGSPNASRSPSPTPPSPPLGPQIVEQPAEYCSPNEAYANSPPRAQIPRRDYLPLPPSPLGLSNYDAFDADEDIPDPYSHFNDDDDDDEEEVPSSLMWDDNDDDVDVVPFSPSAVTSMSSSTIQTRPSQAVNTPQPIYADFNNLDHSEPVFGDYDQVDDGAESIWPSTFAHEANEHIRTSTLPDFHALFATAVSKRSDSFATSPSFRPTIPTSSTLPHHNLYTSYTAHSPNFAPTCLPASTSPKFTALTASAPTVTTSTSSHSRSMSTSPNFTPTSVSSNFVPTAISPNFAAIDAPPRHNRTKSLPSQHRPDGLAPNTSDREQERKRQRNLMFMRFGS